MFEYKRILSAGELPNSKGGIYNPSCVWFNNQLICIARVEQKPEHKRSNWLDTNSVPWIVYLDNDFNPTDKFSLQYHLFDNQFDVFRAEDFRLFIWRNKLYTIHSLVTKEKIHQAISFVDLEYKRLVLLHVFDSPVYRDIEKNWGVFIHNGELHILYSVDPWVIYKLNSQWELELVVRENYYFNWIVSKEQGMLSISTLPIEFDDNYLVITHSRINTVYVQGAVIFDKNTLLPIKATTKSFLSGGSQKGIRPNVLYVSGITVDNNFVYLFYGEGDTHSSLYSIPKQFFKTI